MPELGREDILRLGVGVEERIDLFLRETWAARANECFS